MNKDATRLLRVTVDKETARRAKNSSRRRASIYRQETIEAQLQTWMDYLEDEIDPWKPRNIWLKKKGFEIYVRKSRRKLSRQAFTCLDIANAGLPEKSRGKGRFKAFVAYAIDNHPWDAIFFEHVLNPRLADYLRRLGCYEVIEGQTSSFFYFKEHIIVTGPKCRKAPRDRRFEKLSKAMKLIKARMKK